MTIRPGLKGLSTAPSDWSRPDPETLDLEFSIAQSVLAEFVGSHNASDVLRELVQNEFDAKGTKAELIFGQDSLSILGNGKPIDASGWKRLSVMLGKGQVVGSERVIEAKVNGIGSKNFGLRTLFQFGDQIFISSGGRQTVLHISKGTLPRPIPEPASRNREGIRIDVPYRVSSKLGLEPFDYVREEKALAEFSEDLVTTLIKLAQPNSRKSLRELVVSSERSNRHIRWVQTATEVKSYARKVRAVHRQVRVTERSLDRVDRGRQRTIREMEFLRSLEIPDGLGDQEFPSYFRAHRRSRIKIGVSLRLKGKKIIPDDHGLYFYPIGVVNGLTGNAISINAPFEMTGDRSQILSETNSPWNTWLLESAAKLTIDLLMADWLMRYGPDAFRAVNPNRVASPAGNSYSTILKRLLREQPCWPSRARASGRRKRAVLKKANRTVIPAFKILGGFLSDEKYLDESFCERKDLANLAKEYGAKIFSLNSLVRLKCGGRDAANAATTLSNDEASFSYTEFPKPLKDVGLQKRFAAAFDSLSRRLTNDNKKDLMTAPTTLTADETLSAPVYPLWVIDSSLASAKLIPKSSQLHSQLCEYRSIVSLCKMFDMAGWARGVAQKALEDTVRDDERDALYRHILAVHGQFDPRTKSKLRNAPIIKDHRGNWVKPALITDAIGPSAKLLEPVLHLPNEDYKRDSKLKKALRFRKKVSATNLIEYAKLVVGRPELAADFEEALWKLRRLLSSKVIRRLSLIAFLRNSLGSLSQPAKTYLRTDLNQACLGQGIAFVAGDRNPLFRKLGCPSTPRSSDILKHIQGLREQRMQPSDVELLYATLVETLKQEGSVDKKLAHDEILWVDDRFFAPSDVLVGLTHRKVFLDSVPQINGSKRLLSSSARSLGAHSEPRTHHWVRLFHWIAEKYEDTKGPVTAIERYAIREAYRRLAKMPDGVSHKWPVLLDKQGFLHSLREAEAGTYVIDDDPRLAEAASERNVGVSFADTEAPGSQRFLHNTGVSTLRLATRRIGDSIGKTIPVPKGLDVDSLLRKLQSTDFASAIAALAEFELRIVSGSKVPGPLVLAEKLKARKNLEFVKDLRIRYKVARDTVWVSEEIVIKRDKFVCIAVQNMSHLRGLVSSAIGSLLTENIARQRPLTDSIYRLLDSSSVSEMEQYLRGRGIPWIATKQPTHSPAELETRDETLDEEGNAVTDFVRDMLTQDLTREPAVQVNGHSANQAKGDSPNTKTSTATEASQATRWQLPPIDQVSVQESSAGTSLPVRSRAAGKSRQRSRRWIPPTPEQEERERQIGRRGEKIVHRLELAKAKVLGFDEARVIWVSDENPGSDFDILSVDKDGHDLWIEVKSTSGRHGRFRWSKAEFDRALKHRDRYILYRVYEADSISPTVRSFRDPVKLLLNNAMSLNVGSLNAEVAALDSTDG